MTMPPTTSNHPIPQDNELDVTTETPRPLTHEAALGLIVHLVRTHKGQSQAQFAVAHQLDRCRVSRMERGVGQWTLSELKLVSAPWNIRSDDLIRIARHVLSLIPDEVPCVDFNELEQWPQALTPKNLRDKLPQAALTQLVAMVIPPVRPLEQGHANPVSRPQSSGGAR